MLTIVAGQWNTLRAQAVQGFVQRTARHLVRYFPRRCALVGPDALYATIRLGLKRARHHRLESEACVRSYVELMCLLGAHFDEDQLLPWAGAILSDPTTEADPLGRADRLHEQAWIFLDRTGADAEAWAAPNGHPLMIEVLRQVRDESVESVPMVELADAARRVHQQLWRLFPARCEAVGEAGLSAHLQRSVEQACALGMGSPRGVSLVALLAFSLGAGFERDPLLPWIARALSVPAAGSADAAVPAEERLFVALVAQLRAATRVDGAARPPTAAAA